MCRLSVRLLSSCPRLSLSVLWEAASWWVTDVLPRETDRQAWRNNSALNGPGSLLAHHGGFASRRTVVFPSAVCLQRRLFDCVLWLRSADKSLLAPAVVNWFALSWESRKSCDMMRGQQPLVNRFLAVSSRFWFTGHWKHLLHPDIARAAVNRSCNLFVIYQSLRFTSLSADKVARSLLKLTCDAF